VRYIVGRVNTEFLVMERKMVGEVEVYEPIASTSGAADAGIITDSLNREERERNRPATHRHVFPMTDPPEGLADEDEDDADRAAAEAHQQFLRGE
jgi:hypothetical protein